MSGEMKAFVLPESEPEAKPEKAATDTNETKRISIKEVSVAVAISESKLEPPRPEAKERTSDKSLPIRSMSPSGGMPKISSKPPSHFSTGEPIPLNEDEKRASQKSYAFTFDKMMEANMELVQSVNLLIKMCYLILGVQLFLIIIILFAELRR